jgi:hypothetical protein
MKQTVFLKINDKKRIKRAKRTKNQGREAIAAVTATRMQIHSNLSEKN